MTPIRTALLGYGRSGAALHADPLANNPAFQVAAVCDPDARARQKGAARFGCRAFADHRRLLAEERPDLAVIVTPSHLHAAMACDCLAAGAHALVTKPWALDAAEEETLSGERFGDARAIYEDVAADLRGAAPFPVTPASALALTRVLDALRASHEQNRVVTLAP